MILLPKQLLQINLDLLAKACVLIVVSIKVAKNINHAIDGQNSPDGGPHSHKVV